MTPIVKFNPGFRLSLPDCLILLAGAFASFEAANLDLHFGVAVGFTVGHFFLFCNVIRMRRLQELTWAATFIFLCSVSSTFGVPSWLQSFGITSAVKAVLVFFELRAPSYHGVCWRRVNPTLEKWWILQGGSLS